MTQHIDWNGYYKEFARTHGGEPVLYGQDKETGKGGRFLFRDGWCYSREGAVEYAPLDLEDQQYKREVYWQTRLSVLTQEYKQLRESIINLASLQDVRSAPLVVSQLAFEENEHGQRTRKRVSGPINFRLLLGQLETLSDQIQECEIELAAEFEPEIVQSPNLSAMILAEVEAIDAKRTPS